VLRRLQQSKHLHIRTWETAAAEHPIVGTGSRDRFRPGATLRAYK
jgi:hypothetical protein